MIEKKVLCCLFSNDLGVISTKYRIKLNKHQDGVRWNLKVEDECVKSYTGGVVASGWLTERPGPLNRLFYYFNWLG